MKKEWLYDWYKESNSDDSVTLQGNTLTSKSLMTALEFSKCDQDIEDKSVLFVFLI